MKKKIAKSISIILVILTVLGSMSIMASAAVSWPKGNGKPIKVYTISTGNNTKAYSSASLSSKKGTIYASDELYVYKTGKNNNGTYFAYCSYPVSNGRKNAYIPLSAITTAKAPTAVYTAKANLTTYRRSSGSATAGSISSGDRVYRLASKGSRTQVLYNIGSVSNPSGWRMAWVSTNNFNNYIKNSSSKNSSSDANVSAAVSAALAAAQKAAASANKGYNASAAVAYAKQHAYDGKGLCAEFVADCVAQAGIKIPNYSYYSSSTKSLTGRNLGAYTNPYTCSEAQLRWFKDNGYKVISNPSNSQISVGDLVWNTGDGDNHVVIITGKNSSGTPLYSAHNNARCNATLYAASFVVKLA